MNALSAIGMACFIVTTIFVFCSAAVTFLTTHFLQNGTGVIGLSSVMDVPYLASIPTASTGFPFIGILFGNLFVLLLLPWSALVSAAVSYFCFVIFMDSIANLAMVLIKFSVGL